MSIKYVAAGAAIATGFFAVLATAVAETPQQETLSERTRQVIALRERGLRGAASVTGSYVGKTQHDELGGPTSLKALASSAETIVLGRVMSSLCHLTRDGFSIYTRYEVAVERVFKGKANVGDSIPLVIPGGRILFEDGTWAQLNVPDFLRPANDNRYVLFMRRADSVRPNVNASAGAFIPAFGALGIYPLQTRQGFVYPAGNVRSPLGRSVVAQRLQPDGFLSYIQHLVQHTSGNVLIR